ncbi:MAG: hypothetical protein QE271_06555 [Bacteriovoracaceae bacterium]|nr:hypothetical protein [Bacteriovoracaceae bacterium]
MGRDLSGKLTLHVSHKFSMLCYWLIVIIYFGSHFYNYFVLSRIKFLLWLGILLFSIGFFRFYWRSLKFLYYSYWGLTAMLDTYMLYHLLQNLGEPQSFVTVASSLAIFLLTLIMFYLMYTPLYYPLVSMGDYDFRFRADLKAKFVFLGEVIESRLTDIRRGAGCLTLFRMLEIPCSGTLIMEFLGEVRHYQVHLSSMSEGIPGRGYSYGVRFITANKKERNDVDLLFNYWKQYAQEKMKMKFSIIKN